MSSTEKIYEFICITKDFEDLKLSEPYAILCKSDTIHGLYPPLHRRASNIYIFLNGFLYKKSRSPTPLNKYSPFVNEKIEDYSKRISGDLKCAVVDPFSRVLFLGTETNDIYSTLIELNSIIKNKEY